MRHNKQTFLLWLSSLYIAMGLLFSQISFAAPTMEQVQQQLASHTIVRGEFTQTRHMQMFDAPLTSQGQFLLSREHGLWWQQSTPFPTSLVLTQDTLSQQVGSQPAQVMKVNDNPMVFYFSHVFLSLFKGDTSQLTEQFTLDFQSTNSSSWTLALTPKSAPLNKVFSHITIQGQSDINHIELMEIRGDRTEIEFSQQTHQPASLTPAELAAFSI